MKNHFRTQNDKLIKILTFILQDLNESHEAYGTLLTARDRLQIGREGIVDTLAMYRVHPENTILSTMGKSFIQEYVAVILELQKITILNDKLFTVSELLQAASSI